MRLGRLFLAALLGASPLEAAAAQKRSAAFWTLIDRLGLRNLSAAAIMALLRKSIGHLSMVGNERPAAEYWRADLERILSGAGISTPGAAVRALPSPDCARGRRGPQPLLPQACASVVAEATMQHQLLGAGTRPRP